MSGYPFQMQLASLVLPMLLLQGGKLEITDVKKGTGPAAQPGDFLTMDYTGTLTNGKVFDTSKKPGRAPFKFMIGSGQVIKGWDEGILGMKVGGKRTLSIPPALGYGDRAMGDAIPANSKLLFTVELKSIERVNYVTTKPGKGPAVKFGDSISVHYLGKLKDGKKFDSSYDRNQPFDVQVGRTGLILGFTQALIGMKVGEKRTVTIPPTLGYGERGAGAAIPPNATIVFDLELVKIN